MKPRRTNRTPGWLSGFLSACVLGLVLCPFGFVVAGALGGFSPMLTVVVVPPLVVAAGFLLYRFLARPRDTRLTALHIVLESVCWLVLAAFVVIVSGFNLLRPVERLGLTSGFLLLAIVLCLPLAFLRASDLRQRVSRLAPGVAGGFVVILVAGAAFAAAAYFNTPAAFP